MEKAAGRWERAAGLSPLVPGTPLMFRIQGACEAVHCQPRAPLCVRTKRDNTIQLTKIHQIVATKAKAYTESRKSLQ